MKPSIAFLANAAVSVAAGICLIIDPVCANGNFCGATWPDAVSRCAVNCPSGAPSECADGETCYADTPCEVVEATAKPNPEPTVAQTPPPITAPAPPSGTSQQTLSDPAPSTGGSAPSVYGTCGNGHIGNTICPNNDDCCSQQGFCGKSLEYCSDKVGNLGPDYHDHPQQTTGDENQPNSRPSSGNSDQKVPTMTTDGSSTADKQESKSPDIYPGPPPHGTDKRIIGYYAGWQWYDRDKLADPSNMDFKKMQRVNFAFFQPDAQGNIFGTDRWGDPQLLFGPYSSKSERGIQRCSYDAPDEVACAYHRPSSGLIHLAHAAGAEIYPSIGGWTLSDHYPTLSAKKKTREAFANNCAEIVSYYGFDGVDIDWEYPGYAEHSGTPADTVNFTKLLVAIRAALDDLTTTTGKHYGLTTALPCAPDHIANIEVSKLISVLSEFNLMAYDFHGSWDKVSGVNAPLYPQGFGNDEFSTHRCVENYVTLGVPREKMNVGLPFYGRSFKYANALNQPHGGNDVANWPDDDGTPQYFNIFKKLPVMVRVRDNKSKTQYAYISQKHQNPTGGQAIASSDYPDGLVSFDDERAICDKVHYVLKNGLGGFIIWELSGDMLEGLRTPLLDITNEKLRNPELECCILHSAEECVKEKSEQKETLSNSQGGFDGALWTKTSAGTRAGMWATLFFTLILTNYLGQ